MIETAANPETIESHPKQTRTVTPKPPLLIVRTPQETLEHRLSQQPLSPKSKKDKLSHIIHGADRTRYTIQDGDDAVYAPEATEKDVPIETRKDYADLPWWDRALFRLPDNTITYEKIVKDLEEEHITDREETQALYFQNQHKYH